MPDDEHFPPAPEPPAEGNSPLEDLQFSRRDFLAGATAVGTGLMASQWLSPLARSLSAAEGGSGQLGADTFPLTLRINKVEHTLQIDPRVTLLDALRERLQMTGTKKGCDRGQCGACTVLVNGRRINSCLSLALTHAGDEITTIEGLAQGDQLHPVQAAFVKHDGFQCGYCTPGQICSAVACIEEGHTGSDDEIREWMSGNICRCGAYPNIVAAIKEARDQRQAAPQAVALAS